MKEISKQDIETLLKLQEAETQIVKLESSLAMDKERQAELKARQERFEQGLEKQRQDLNSCAVSCKEIEEEVRLIDQRIVKSNETLRMVRSNKEYQVLLRELEDNRRRKDDIETSLLEFMEEKERLSTAFEETKREFVQLQSNLRAETERIVSQLAGNKKLVENYKTEQKQIGEELDPGLLSLFKRISRMNRGLAVAKVQDSVCMGCFMNIPPQLYIEVQRGKELISCPQCSRILYYETETQEA